MVTLTVKITKLISTENKLAQGAFGSKSKLVHKYSQKILERLLIQAKSDDLRVKTEFTAMANVIDDLKAELASLTSDKKKVKGMVGKGKKVLQSGLKRKLEGSR